MIYDDDLRCENCACYYFSKIDRSHVCVNSLSPFAGEEMDPDESCYEYKAKESEE